MSTLFNNPIADGLHRNSNALIGLGSGLLQGKNWSEGMALGGQRFADGSHNDGLAAAQRKQETVAENQRNQTAAFLRKMGEEQLAVGIENNMIDGQTAYKLWHDKKNGGVNGDNSPATVREWEHFNALSPDQQGQYLRMKRASPYLDVGTGFVQPDPVNPGQVAGGPIVKHNEQAAFDTATGTGLGKANAENIVSAESLASKLPGLRTVIGELSELAKTATYTVTGQVIDSAMKEAGLEPSEAAIARTRYIAIVDNQVLPLLRDTFGAAFTVKEGETLRATLGDPNKSPAEKQAVLEAFIAQKERDVAGMQSRIPGQEGGSDIDAILSGYGL